MKEIKTIHYIFLVFKIMHIENLFIHQKNKKTKDIDEPFKVPGR